MAGREEGKRGTVHCTSSFDVSGTSFAIHVGLCREDGVCMYIHTYRYVQYMHVHQRNTHAGPGPKKMKAHRRSKEAIGSSERYPPQG